jgi:osmoprotectant transport system permease protein
MWDIEATALVAEVTAWTKAQHGVTTMGTIAIENTSVLAMQGDTARAKSIASIDDLRAVAGSLTLDTDLEFPDRPEWATIRQTYGLRFSRQRTFNPIFMYDALKSGDADVICAFSLDGRIAADGLIVLTDPRSATPSYDALLRVGPRAARDARLVAMVRPFVGAIPVDVMRKANFIVDREKDKSSSDAAARWLATATGR